MWGVEPCRCIRFRSMSSIPSSNSASDQHMVTMRLLCARAGFLWLLLLNAFTAYFQNLSNFLVTKATSPLTLQVRGHAEPGLAFLSDDATLR